MPAANAAPPAIDLDNLQGALKQIARAGALERERADVQSRISRNREYLRLMRDNDELSGKQKNWLDSFYSEKEKGERRTAEEIERTRQAKQAARDAGKDNEAEAAWLAKLA